MVNSSFQARISKKLKAQARIGVVDIGSNSVRLVVFDGECRSPQVHYNEKAICALGSELRKTNRLAHDGVVETLSLLKRFRLLTQNMGVTQLHVVATAATREAKNGASFVKLAEKAIASPVKVLSGAEEAQFAAAGVISGMPHADGVVGDLGGGSLELVDAVIGIAGVGESAPIGTLRLLEQVSKPKDAISIVDRALSKMDLVEKIKGRSLYLVGGTWRAIARIHMEHNNYPLHIIDHYELAPQDATEIVQLVGGLSMASLRNMPNVSLERLTTIPFGALVLERLISMGKPKNIVFSANGLREGIVYSNLSPKIAGKDPLISSVYAISALYARSLTQGSEIADWVDPLFSSLDEPETDEERHLRKAACHLGDLSWRIHPDYRGSHSIDVVVHGNLADMHHAGRAFLALSSYFCHANRIRHPSAQAMSKLVNKKSLEKSRIIGKLLRLSFALTGATDGILPKCPIICDQHCVELYLPYDLADLGGGMLERRLASLAGAIGRKYKIIISDSQQA